MTRDSYDGLQDDGSDLRTGGKPRKLIFTVVILLGFVIVLLAIVLLWNKLFPAPSPNDQPASQQTDVVQVQPPVAAEVQKVEDAPSVVIADVPKSETPAPAALPQEPSKPTVTRTTTAVSLDETPKIVRNTKNMVQFADHQVKDGESLDSIAQSYGLKTQTLINVNQIRNVNAITAGVTLRIPDRDGQIYVVKSGDMLSTIARSYNMGWHTLMDLNGLTSDMIRPGQELFIPDSTAQSTASGSAAEVATVNFQKPTKGKVVLSFTQSASDPVDGNGILIEGTWGDAVLASADGNVVDVGIEPQGRGRFVVISHADGYKTTYAHLESVEVRGGDKVSAGQMIGIIGTSGTTWDTPKLFFKLEQSSYALDPASFF